MKVLVLNAGSSTVKFSLLESDGEAVLLEGLADWSSRPAKLVVRRPGKEQAQSELPAEGHREAARHLLEKLTRDEASVLSGVSAIGHRVVHGGSFYTSGVRIDAEVTERIRKLSELAPLHNPVALEVIEVARAAWPDVPQVACFDTAFHATLPPAARTYALPQAWTNDWGLRRYGFHGLSHAYCADRAARMLQREPVGLRLVICHLGNGCSATAVRDGKSLDTSMGFTPLEGLMMGTRSGSVDPGLLLYVLREKAVTPEEVDQTLNKKSGLLGVSGISSDMRAVLEAVASGNPDASLALDIYVHRLRHTIGAMAATLGGLDALVFTAGIGEHAARVRSAACAELQFLGLELDEAANNSCRPDADIAAARSPGRILVIATREDVTILREAVRVVEQAHSAV
jgi:acetate kinase